MDSDEEQKNQQQNEQEEPEKELKKLTKKNVFYCQACSLPPEFCMFQSNSKIRKCQEWLKINNPKLYIQIYSQPQEDKKEGAADQQKQPDQKKPEGQQEEEKKEQQKEQPQLTPEELERLEIQKQQKTAKLMMQGDNKITVLLTRRKFKKMVTVITGLSKYGVNLKEAAKKFRHKFACGAKEEGEEVEIQGEVDDVIADFIISEWKHINQNVFVYKKDGEKKK